MLSAVVLTKDEQDNISNCLRTLSFCDEIIVIDDISSDKTASLAKKYGAKVLKRRLDRDFAAQRNFALKQVRGNWVLYIDADERVSAELAREIKKSVESGKYNAYYLKREDVFMGKRMKGGEWGGQFIIRLAKKGAGKWVRAVHERWVVSEPVGKLSSPLLHSPHPSLRGFLEDINIYSTVHASQNELEGKETNLLKIISMPALKFIYNFAVKGGYEDGTAGFVYSMFMSMHSYLAWSKQWEKQNIE